MNYTGDVKRFVIDLALSPHERWREVIAADREVTLHLIRSGWSDAMRDAAKLSGRPQKFIESAARIARNPFHSVYRLVRGRYLDEIYSWADALDMDRALCVLMQCMYELSHLDPVRPPRNAPGCSSGAVWAENIGGMAQARTLDWSFSAIGPATRIFEFRRGARNHFVVGMPGLVGALSGMVPGGFSATINWAPPATFPFFYTGPLFELRDALETCDTYEQAVKRLSTSRLATSVFFTVCGVRRGEACVIERVKTRLAGGQQVRVRHAGDGWIAQTNHYQHPDFARFNAIAETGRSALMKTSEQRAGLLATGLRRVAKSRGLEQIAGALSDPPVENEMTRQKMVFCPATGGLNVWREIRAEADAG